MKSRISTALKILALVIVCMYTTACAVKLGSYEVSCFKYEKIYPEAYHVLLQDNTPDTIPWAFQQIERVSGPAGLPFTPTLLRTTNDQVFDAVIDGENNIIVFAIPDTTFHALNIEVTEILHSMEGYKVIPIMIYGVNMGTDGFIMANRFQTGGNFRIDGTYPKTVWLHFNFKNFERQFPGASYIAVQTTAAFSVRISNIWISKKSS